MEPLQIFSLYGGESPCEKFKCDLRSHCSEKNRACNAFARFVAKGIADYELFCSQPVPNIENYRKLFGSKK